MSKVSGEDLKMLAIFLFFLVFNTFVIWLVQVCQDRIGKLKTITSIYKHLLSKGPIGILFIQYSLTFTFDLSCYTIYPWIVLLKSREDYHQIWTEMPHQKVNKAGDIIKYGVFFL